MDREPGKLPTEFDDKTTALFSEFMLRVAKFEELVDIARQFLTGFCQELETFRRPQLYKTSKVVDHIIDANQTSRMEAYVEAGSRHRHQDIQNIVRYCTVLKEAPHPLLIHQYITIRRACLISVCYGVTLVPIQVHSCMQVLQDHLVKVKVLLSELECLKEDAIGTAQKVNHSTRQIYTCDEEGLSLEEEGIEKSTHLQEKSTSYATLMAVIYNMLMLDYTMQENIINSINWTAAKPEHLESYCLMWNLRPYINDSVMRQGWKLVS